MITLSTDLTTFVPKFNAEVNYTKQNEKEMVAIIAERIADIYSKFLTKKGHDNRSKELKFNDFPPLFPSDEEVTVFKKNLKATIIEKMSVGREYGDSVKLFVHYVPNGTLEEVVDKSGIGSHSQFSQYLLHFYPRNQAPQFPKSPRSVSSELK